MRPFKIERPIVLAGPCTAESYEILESVVEPLRDLSIRLDFDYYFKASFDKANRTSFNSYRGPGIETAARWFEKIKQKYGVKIITDIHETAQVSKIAPFVDMLQIPAFLSRQTDLLIAALETGKQVNVKKGQFMAPEAAAQIVAKAKDSGLLSKTGLNGLLLTERGASFGYSNLVVDMRGLKIMAESGVPIIFDITHSTQIPSQSSKTAGTSGAQREFAPLLARCAAASGYVDGFFLEVHPEPNLAKSDAEAQLTPTQAITLLEHVLPLLREAKVLAQKDPLFCN